MVKVLKLPSAGLYDHCFIDSNLNRLLTLSYPVYDPHMLGHVPKAVHGPVLQPSFLSKTHTDI